MSAFYDKVLDSQNLAVFFKNADVPTLIDHQTQFITYVMGGPASVSDETLRRAHARLDITERDFDEIVDIMKETLEDHDVEDADIQHVENEIRRREHLIVTRTSSGA